MLLQSGYTADAHVVQARFKCGAGSLRAREKQRSGSQARVKCGPSAVQVWFERVSRVRERVRARRVCISSGARAWFKCGSGVVQVLRAWRMRGSSVVQVSSMADSCCECGSRVVQVWSQCGPGVAQVLPERVPRFHEWFKCGSSVKLKFGSSVVQVWFRARGRFTRGSSA
eukprot:9466264-Pyramimonas_sp.AAC.1